MEQAFLVLAIVCFFLAAVSLMACIAVFVRLDVMNAIRFLRHKPLRDRAAPRRKPFVGERDRGMRGAKPVNAAPGAEGAGSAEGAKGARLVPAASLAVQSNETSPKPYRGPTDLPQEDSEQPTGLLQDDSEQPTGLLQDESEQPTGLLQDDSEQPTGLLQEGSEHPTGLLREESEQPTGLLPESSEQPTGLLQEGSEQPTGLLQEESEQPTGLLSEESEQPTGLLQGSGGQQRPDTPQELADAAQGVVQHESPAFRFTLKRNVVVIHTDEEIE